MSARSKPVVCACAPERFAGGVAIGGLLQVTTPLAGARLCEHGIVIDVLGWRVVRLPRGDVAGLLLREGGVFLRVRLLVPARTRGITFRPGESQRFLARARVLGYAVRSSAEVGPAELAALDPQDSFARWRFLADLGLAWIGYATVFAVYWIVGDVACAPGAEAGHAGPRSSPFGWMALAVAGVGCAMLVAGRIAGWWKRRR